MLKFSQYIEDVKDKAWFDSSNIVYGECDESDTQYKTVRIVFKNGAIYQYYDVLVHDWVKFKNADSQGKSLNEYFKKPGYKFERIGNANIDEIMAEYDELSATDYILNVDRSNLQLVLLDKNFTEKFTMDYPGKKTVEDIKNMLESINLRVKFQDI